MGLFDFRSAAQRKRDDEKYANRIFPRGIQVQDEIFALFAELSPKSSKRWLMMTFVCGKEGVLRLRSKSELAPTREQERQAALKHINPKHSKLTEEETAICPGPGFCRFNRRCRRAHGNCPGTKITAFRRCSLLLQISCYNIGTKVALQKLYYAFIANAHTLAYAI